MFPLTVVVATRACLYPVRTRPLGEGVWCPPVSPSVHSHISPPPPVGGGVGPRGIYGATETYVTQGAGRPDRTGQDTPRLQVVRAEYTSTGLGEGF